MSAAIPLNTGRASRAVLAITMCVLAAAALWFLWPRWHYVVDFSPASYTEYFWGRRGGLVLHLAGGFLALTAGLVQIWLGLTGRTSTLHRSLGRVYVAGVLIGCIGGFYMAATINDVLPYRIGLFGLDLAWLVTTGMAVFAIRQRKFQQHREWMLRSYIVTFAFVTYRLESSALRHWLAMPDIQNAD
jgi:uncharacterized membrane protein